MISNGYVLTTKVDHEDREISLGSLLKAVDLNLFMVCKQVPQTTHLLTSLPRPVKD